MAEGQEKITSNKKKIRAREERDWLVRCSASVSVSQSAGVVLVDAFCMNSELARGKRAEDKFVLLCFEAWRVARGMQNAWCNASNSIPYLA